MQANDAVVSIPRSIEEGTDLMFAGLPAGEFYAGGYRDGGIFEQRLILKLRQVEA